MLPVLILIITLICFAEDDEFSSAPADGVLSYTLPSVMDLFNQPLEAFNGDGGLPDGHSKDLRFQIAVHNSDTDEVLRDDQGQTSDVRYRRHQTPMLHDVVPNQVYKGQKIQWFVNPLGSLHAGSVEADKEPVQELRIGGATTDWDGLIDSGTRPAQYSVGSPLTTIVGG